MIKLNDTSKIDWSKSFYYDETSPSCLRWKISIILGKYDNIVRVSPGDTAGTIQKDGRWLVTLQGKRTYVHRIIFQLFGNDVSSYVDHIDGNPKNNLITNLRPVTQKINLQNKCKQSNNTSGITGVSCYERVCNGKIYRYWRARWHDKNGKGCTKFFSIDKYGDETAFNLAKDYRANTIKRLVQEGGSYTDRHGL